MAKKKPAKASRQSSDSAKPNKARTRTKAKAGAVSKERPSEATEPTPAGDCAATLEQNNIDGTIAATLKAEKLLRLDGIVRDELERLLRGFEAELCEARRATSANAKLVNELEAYHRSMAAAISDAMKLLTLFPFAVGQGARVREAAACLLLNADDAKPDEGCKKFFSCGGRVPAFGLSFQSHAEAVWHLVIVIADFVRDIDAKFDDRPFSVVVDQHSPVESPREEVLVPLRPFVVRLLEAIITRKWSHLPHPRRLTVAEETDQPVKQFQLGTADLPPVEEPTKQQAFAENSREMRETPVDLKAAGAMFQPTVPRTTLEHWISRGLKVKGAVVILGTYRNGGSVWTTKEEIVRFQKATNKRGT